MRIQKATTQEKSEYQATGPIYPLYGFVTVDGHKCVIEDLRGMWSKPNPIYEVIAPDGMMFEECLHSLLCFSLADVRERLQGQGLEKSELPEHME